MSQKIIIILDASSSMASIKHKIKNVWKELAKIGNVDYLITFNDSAKIYENIKFVNPTESENNLRWQSSSEITTFETGGWTYMSTVIDKLCNIVRQIGWGNVKIITITDGELSETDFKKKVKPWLYLKTNCNISQFSIRIQNGSQSPDSFAQMLLSAKGTLKHLEHYDGTWDPIELSTFVLSDITCHPHLPKYVNEFCYENTTLDSLLQIPEFEHIFNSTRFVDVIESILRVCSCASESDHLTMVIEKILGMSERFTQRNKWLNAITNQSGTHTQNELNEKFLGNKDFCEAMKTGSSTNDNVFNRGNIQRPSFTQLPNGCAIRFAISAVQGDFSNLIESHGVAALTKNKDAMLVRMYVDKPNLNGMFVRIEMFTQNGGKLSTTIGQIVKPKFGSIVIKPLTTVETGISNGGSVHSGDVGDIKVLSPNSKSSKFLTANGQDDAFIVYVTNSVRPHTQPKWARIPRYKMPPRLCVKVEGGIKTVIVNMVEVAKALNRPPAYPTKYFGCELGVQTQVDPENERYIVYGSHDASKLQDLLDGFIHKYVLCPECDNLETDLKINDNISQSCKTCGYHGLLKVQHKLNDFILNNPTNLTKGWHSKRSNISEHGAFAFSCASRNSSMQSKRSSDNIFAQIAPAMPGVYSSAFSSTESDSIFRNVASPRESSMQSKRSGDNIFGQIAPAISSSFSSTESDSIFRNVASCGDRRLHTAQSVISTEKSVYNDNIKHDDTGFPVVVEFNTGYNSTCNILDDINPDDFCDILNYSINANIIPTCDPFAFSKNEITRMQIDNDVVECFTPHQMKNEYNRLQTFGNWPCKIIDKETFAMSGFYVHSDLNIIKCAFCFVKIKSWEHGDDILAVHKKLSQNCPLMLQKRTENIPIDPSALALKLGPPPSSDICGFGLHQTIKSRMETFQRFGWPEQMIQTPYHMSVAGFFYTGFGDTVECFECKIKLSNWKAFDDPMEEHKKYSKNCIYILRQQRENIS